MDVLPNEVRFLGALLASLEVDSPLWREVAEVRGQLLRRHFASELRWHLVGEPTSVIDL